MSTALVEGVQSGIGRLWVAKQTASGSMTAAGSANQFSPKLVESTLVAHKAFDKAEYVDGEKYENSQIFTNEIAGELGNFKILGQPESAGRLLAHFFNEDVVTGTGPYVHTITTTGVGGLYNTIHQLTGATGNAVEHIYWDALLDMFSFECSSADPASMLDFKVIGRVGGQVYTSAPTAAIASQDAIAWPNVEGTITIDGTVYESIQGEKIEVDNQSDIARGDSPEVVSFISKRGTVTRSLTTFFNDETLPLFYLSLYNDSTPAAGAVPTSDVVSADVSTTYTVATNQYITFTTPNLTFEPQEFQPVSPKGEGGAMELTLSGACRKDGSDPALTIEVGSTTSSAAWV